MKGSHRSNWLLRSPTSGPLRGQSKDQNRKNPQELPNHMLAGPARGAGRAKQAAFLHGRSVSPLLDLAIW
jgi:hypothetical protein